MATKEARKLNNLVSLGQNFIFFLKLAYKSAPSAFIVCWVINIAVSAFPAITSKILGNFINSVAAFIKDGNTSQVWSVLLIYIGVSLVPTILNVFEGSSTNILYLKFTDFLERYVLEKRGSFDIAHLEDTVFLNKLQSAFNQWTGPIIALIDVGISASQLLLTLVINSIVIFAVDWRIFVLVIVLSIPKLLVEMRYGGRQFNLLAQNSYEKRMFQELRSYFWSRYAIIESKLFQFQKFFMGKMEKILNDFTEKQVAMEHERSKFRLFSELLSSAGLFGGLAIVILDIIHGHGSVGTVAFVFSIINSFRSNASQFFNSFARLLERNLYVAEIVDVLHTEPVIKEVAHLKDLSTKETPDIEFVNVSFKYPGTEHVVLHNISFKIQKGKKLGMVGHNGSGKTTIVRLLLRIHDPIEGRILVNGIDLKELRIEDWWTLLGVLPQDYTSMHVEAKHAISYGDIKKNFDISKVREAAQNSTASEFIEEWSDTYERMIGVEFGGEELSKGERQKIALARVFYRDPKIFVLDEPTAAVDSQSTSKIFRNIEKISKEQSAFIISHNFATLRRADEILVLDHGKIIGHGSHEELMGQNGLYKTLYDEQRGEYE